MIQEATLQQIYYLYKTMGNTLLKSIGLALVAFFAPIVPLIILIGFAIMTDTVFGIIASIKNKKPIVSNKLARILTKSIIYLSLILLFYGVDVVLINAILTKKFGINLLLTKFAAVIITIVEGFSIDEKIRSFNDGKGIWFYIKKILAKGKQLTGSLKDIKEDLKDEE